MRRIHVLDADPAVEAVARSAGLAIDCEAADAVVLTLAEGGPEREAKLAAAVAKGPVLVVGDEADVAYALSRGIEAVRWPCGPELLILRLESAVQRRRLAFHERFFELAKDSVEYTGLDLRLEGVNGGFEAMTGFRVEQVLGKTPGEMFRTGRRDADVYKDIGATFERNEVWQGALVQRRHDGSVFFPQSILAPVDQGPVRIGFLGIKRDPDGDEFTTSAAAATEKRMQEVVEKAGDALFVVTLGGELADVNRVACDILGLTRAALLSRQLVHILGSMPTPIVEQMMAADPGPPVNIEADLHRDDGGTIPVELRSGRITLGGEDFLLILARDVTERRRAQEASKRLNAELVELNDSLENQVADRTAALDEALQRLTAVFDSVVDGLLHVGRDGAIRRVNPAMGFLLGGADQTLIGRVVEEALAPELTSAIRSCLKDGDERTVEFILGRQHLGLARIAAIQASPGVIGCVVLVRDVTLEREIDRMKTDFITTVSHELRTPLTSILGFVKLVHRRLNDVILPKTDASDAKTARVIGQVRTNLGIVATEGVRLTKLINDVLDLSKMDAGRVEWTMEPVDPKQLVALSTAATGSLFAGSAVAIRTEIPMDLPPVLGDRDRLVQVLVNLLSNAQKFTTEGHVTVSARQVDGGLELEVADTGDGIDPSEHEVIFERFKQIGDPLTAKPGGTGLGLPICRQIASAHRGRIWVDSTLGKGSRFILFLPAAPT